MGLQFFESHFQNLKEQIKLKNSGNYGRLPRLDFYNGVSAWPLAFQLLLLFEFTLLLSIYIHF